MQGIKFRGREDEKDPERKRETVGLQKKNFRAERRKLK